MPDAAKGAGSAYAPPRFAEVVREARDQTPSETVKALLAQPQEPPFRQLVHDVQVQPDAWGDVQRDPLGYDFPLWNQKVALDDNHPFYRMDFWLEAADTDADDQAGPDGAPLPHVSKSKETFTFLIVRENVLMAEIGKDEAKQYGSLHKHFQDLGRLVMDKHDFDALTPSEREPGKDRRDDLADETATLTLALAKVNDPDVKTSDLLQQSVRAGNVIEALEKSLAETRVAVDKYDKLLREEQLNVVNKDVIDYTQKNILEKLQDLLAANGDFAQAQDGIAKFRKALDDKAASDKDHVDAARGRQGPPAEDDDADEGPVRRAGVDARPREPSVVEGPADGHRHGGGKLEERHQGDPGALEGEFFDQSVQISREPTSGLIFLVPELCSGMHFRETPFGAVPRRDAKREFRGRHSPNRSSGTRANRRRTRWRRAFGSSIIRESGTHPPGASPPSDVRGRFLMTRRLLAVLAVTAALFALTVRADDPTAKPADPKNPAARTEGRRGPDGQAARAGRAKEKKLREQFEAFKNEVIKLKERLATSDKEEDKQTVQVLQRVLTEIDTLKVKQKFHDVDAILSDANVLEPRTRMSGDAAKNNTELHEAMQKLIAILDNLDDADRRSTRKSRRTRSCCEQLKEILSEQERLIAADRPRPEDRQGPGQGPKQDQRQASRARSTDRQGQEARLQQERGQVRQQARPRRQERGQERHRRPQGRGEGRQAGRPERSQARPGQDRREQGRHEAGRGKDGENKDGMKPSDGKTGENKDGMKPGEGKKGDKPARARTATSRAKSKDGKGDDKAGKPGEGRRPAPSPRTIKRPSRANRRTARAATARKASRATARKARSRTRTRTARRARASPATSPPATSRARPSRASKAGRRRTAASPATIKRARPASRRTARAATRRTARPASRRTASRASRAARTSRATAKDGKGDSKPGEGKQASAGDPNGKPGEAKEGDKPGDGKPGQAGQPKEGAKPGDAKPGEAKAGDGKGDSKPGEGKGNEAKPAAGAGEPKPGDGKPGQPGDGKPGKPGDGRKASRATARPARARRARRRTASRATASPATASRATTRAAATARARATARPTPRPATRSPA